MNWLSRQVLRWSSVAVMAVPSVAGAQDYHYSNNGDGTCTITGGHFGTNVTVIVPRTIDSLKVVGIADFAFSGYGYDKLLSITLPDSVTNIGFLAFFDTPSLTSISVDPLNSFYCSPDGVLFNKSLNTLIECPGGIAGRYMIPDGVINIGSGAFERCRKLTDVTIPNSVTCIGDQTFDQCTGLTSVTIPNSITNIGYRAFMSCANLAGITIPNSVTCLGDGVFYMCDGLKSVYFKGCAPALGMGVFSSTNVFDPTTIYYLAGTTNWTNPWGNRTAVLFNPQFQSDSTFGVLTNCFGFTFTNAGSPTVVVEACTNLTSPAWNPVATNTLTGGSSYFGDPDWTNYPARFYRFQMP